MRLQLPLVIISRITPKRRGNAGRNENLQQESFLDLELQNFH